MLKFEPLIPSHKKFYYNIAKRCPFIEIGLVTYGRLWTGKLDCSVSFSVDRVKDKNLENYLLILELDRLYEHFQFCVMLRFFFHDLNDDICRLEVKGSK